MEYVYGEVRLSLPRTAAAQAAIGAALERDTTELRPGDLLTFATRERAPVTHIGIYVGGGRFVHASSVAGRVIESDVYRAPAPRIKLWKGVRRLPVPGERTPLPALSLDAPER